jgi:hypothetical protein
LNDELRLKARAVLERIYYEHLPQSEWRGQQVRFDSGEIYRNELDYSRALTDSQRIAFEFRRDDLELKDRPGLRGQWGRRQEGVVRIETTFSRRWDTAIWGGASEAGALGGASVRRRLGEQRDLTLSLHANERAVEGLLVELLDGRQHRLTLAGNYLMERDWLFYFQVNGRELVLDGKTLAHSLGANWNLEKILFQPIPDWRVGYRGQWIRTDRARGANPGLVDDVASPGASLADRMALLQGMTRPEFHRHGIYTMWRDQLSGVVHYFGTVGVDYALDQESFEYNGGAGISVFPRKSIELRTEVGYTSSAATSEADSEQWQLSVALKYYF